MSARQRLLTIGMALVLAVNAFVLLGVAWNRRGSPESQLTLTQRELSLAWNGAGNREDSGLSLRLQWRVADVHENSSATAHSLARAATGSNGIGLPWLDEQHLSALGVDVARLKDGERLHGSRRSRTEWPILVAMEFDGPAWQQAREQVRLHAEQQAALLESNPRLPGITQSAKQAQEARSEEDTIRSRLFAVDAGTDLAVLRARYPDRRHYLILRATLGVQSTYRDRVPTLSGYIERLDIGALHVPYAFRSSVSSWAGQDFRIKGRGPVFTATVAVGERLEPWIEAVTAP